MAEMRTPGRVTPGRRRNANKENVYFEPGKFGRYGDICAGSMLEAEEQQTDRATGRLVLLSKILESAMSMDSSLLAVFSRRLIALRQSDNLQSAHK